MMKRNIKRRGFTLVELLIVIVVIGILSAMMMLSSTEAVTSAKASNIVSNLRNLKTAALAMYIDNMAKFDNGTLVVPETPKTSSNSENQDGDDQNNQGKGTEIDIGYVIKYMNGGDDLPEKQYYAITSTNKGDWYLQYTIQGTDTEKTQIKHKLAGRAASVGLLKEKANTSGNTYVATSDNQSDTVYYFVR